MGVELARCGEKNMRGSFLLVTVLSFPVSELYESIITHAFFGGGVYPCIFKQGMVSNQMQQEFL